MLTYRFQNLLVLNLWEMGPEIYQINTSLHPSPQVIPVNFAKHRLPSPIAIKSTCFTFLNQEEKIFLPQGPDLRKVKESQSLKHLHMSIMALDLSPETLWSRCVGRCSEKVSFDLKEVVVEDAKETRGG